MQERAGTRRTGARRWVLVLGAVVIGASSLVMVTAPAAEAAVAPAEVTQRHGDDVVQLPFTVRSQTFIKVYENGSLYCAVETALIFPKDTPGYPSHVPGPVPSEHIYVQRPGRQATAVFLADLFEAPAPVPFEESTWSYGAPGSARYSGGPTWWGRDCETEELEATRTRLVSEAATYTAWGPRSAHLFVLCRVTSQTGPGGRDITFSAEVDTDGSGYQQEWTFGDGTTSSATSVAKTATLPGTFAASFRAWRPGTNQNVRANCDADVRAPELGVEVDILGPDGEPVAPDDPPGVGDVVDVRLRVSAASDGVGQLRNLTSAESEWLRAVGPVELVEAPEAPAPFALQPGERRDLVYRYEILSAGELAFSSSIIGEDAIGRPVAGEGSALDTVGGIGVDVKASWPEPPGGSDQPAEFQADNNGDGEVNDLDHVLTVEVTATNLLDEPLSDVRMREQDEAIDFVNRMLGEGAAAIELIAGNDYSTDFGDLEPGGGRTRTYEFQAIEEVDADAHAYLRGDTEAGSVVSGHGETRVVLDSHLALEAWMDLEERPYQSGQVVRLSGQITNLLEDETLPDGTVEEADSLAVILDPIVEGNASNGYAMTSDYGGRTPQGNTPFVLEPGESLDVRAIVPTARKDIESMAGVRYLVRAWALDPEDPEALGVEIDQSRIVIDDEDGRGTEFSTPLLPVQLRPDKVEECETTDLDAIITCNLWVGFREFGTGLAQLGPVIATGTVEYVRAGWAIRGWMIEQWMRSAQALLGDEEAQQRLITEIEVQMNTFVEARLMSAEALDAVGGAVVEFFQEAEVALRTGDTDQIVAWTARFLGENPDLGMAALAKVRAARALFGVALPSGSQSQATATLVRATDEAAAAERLALEAKIDEAIARGENPATNGTFKGDEDITNIPRVFRGIYGARKTELNKMLDLAAAENILIAFRQRSARAADLIKRGLARVKPMDVKTKGVNEIDIAYLGYRREAKDLVELVEPPIDWRLARKGREAEFEAALDDYMDFLQGHHPEIGADPVWRSEVRNRLKTRTKQWIKEVPNFRRYATEGINVEFGYAEQGLPASLDDHVAEIRKARVNQGTVVDPYTGQKRLYFNVEMADEFGNNFLPITGDIDIVAILNSDRTPITDVNKRARIYKELAKLVGMQHGDSITWINTEGMIEFLREHIAGKPGAEALVVAGSDHKARMGYFEERLSEVTDVDGNVATKNTFHLVTGAPREMITDPTGGAPTNLPSYFDDLESYTLDPKFYLPGALEDFMDGVEIIGGPPALDDTAPVIRPDGEGGAEAFQAGSGGSPDARRAMVATSADADPLDVVADEIAAAGFGPATEPDIGAEGGRWVPYDAVAAADASPTGRFPRGVVTATDGDLASGTTDLPVADLDTLGVAATSDWFKPGDRIVVDPGGAREEAHVVAAASARTVTLTTPLRNDHTHATTVALVARATDPTVPTDPTDPTEPAVPTTAAPSTGAAGSGTTAPAPASGTLPRTGMPASSAAALGIALLAAGIGILTARSRARNRTVPT